MIRRRATFAGLAVAAAVLAFTATAAADAPPGATALCRDGTYSFSQTHSGTCSHHGGVAAWLDGGSTPNPSPAPGAGHPPIVGLRSKTAGCRASAGLPDGRCTPGAVFTDATAARVCVPGYSGSVRNVPESEKQAVYAEYGIRSHSRGQYEVDHLISLELGGSNSIANLWPEAARPSPGFHEKDKFENYLHGRICSGGMTITEAQHLIASNWISAYHSLLR